MKYFAFLAALFFCAIPSFSQSERFKLYSIEFTKPGEERIFLDYKDYAHTAELKKDAFIVPSFQYTYKLKSRVLASRTNSKILYSGIWKDDKGVERKFEQEVFIEYGRILFTFFLIGNGKAIFRCGSKQVPDEEIRDNSGPLDTVTTTITQQPESRQQSQSQFQFQVEEVQTEVAGKEKPIIDLRGRNVLITLDLLAKKLTINKPTESHYNYKELNKVDEDDQSILYEGIAERESSRWKLSLYAEKNSSWTVIKLSSLSDEKTSMSYICKGRLETFDKPTVKSRSVIKEVTLGTGFFVGVEGIIATNAHVVSDVESLSVQVNYVSGSQLFKAKVITVDRENDIAILKIISKEFSKPISLPYEFVNADIGERVFTIGYPLNAIMGNNFKLTDGLVSSTTGMGDDSRYYQISVPLQPGNSGGPLFDSDGNIIGITTSRLDGEKIGLKVENVGYAIKIEHLSRLLQSSGLQIPNFKNSLKNMSLKEQVKTLKHYIVVINGRL